jgi:hypothetical protein
MHSRPCVLVNGTQVKPINARDLGLPDYVHQVEHPYEIMASIIPEIILERKQPSTEAEKTIQKMMV